jgi:hypothetical protein
MSDKARELATQIVTEYYGKVQDIGANPQELIDGFTQAIQQALDEQAAEGVALREASEPLRLHFQAIADDEWPNRNYPDSQCLHYNDIAVTRQQLEVFLQALTQPTPRVAQIMAVVEAAVEIVQDDIQRAGGVEYLINKIEHGSSWMVEDMIPLVKAVEALKGGN